MSKKKICFVIAPIGDEGSETRERSDQILEFIIEPAAKECGYEPPIRADSFSKPGIITRQIIEQLMEAQLVIADLTDHNANVFYELAVRHAIKKPIVQLIERGQTIPFDVGGMRVIYVTNRDLAFADKARRELIEQIKTAEVDPEASENPISTTVELGALRQSERSSDKAMAEILESVQRIERQLRDEQVTESLVRMIMRVLDTRVTPPSGGMSLIGENPYTRISTHGRILPEEYLERKTPPTDVTGGPKST